MSSKYKKMLDGMASSKMKVASPEENWFVYILTCSDGSFYTGVTNNLDKRFKCHQGGRGARYTRTRLPVTLSYSEDCKNRSEALIREYKVKRLPKKKKAELMKQVKKE